MDSLPKTDFILLVNETTLRVDAFESKNYALSQDYQFVIQVIDQTPLNLNETLGAPAKLSIENGNDSTNIHGIITDAQGPMRTPDINLYGYTLTINSPLYLLTQNKGCKVFIKKTINEIIEEILAPHDINYQLLAEARFPLYEQMTQYNESDYNFLLRQLNHFGLFFTFFADKLIITDNIANLMNRQKTELPFKYSTGANNSSPSVFSITANGTLLAATTKIRDYNYCAPELELTAEQKQKNTLKAYGEHYIFATGQHTQTEAEELATIYQQSLDWQRYIIEAETDFINLFPGQELEITNNPLAKNNEHYYIIAMKMMGDQTHGRIFGTSRFDLTYYCKIKLAPANAPYKNSIKLPQNSASLHIGTIAATDDKIPDLDELGRYRVKFNYDLENKPTTQASKALRLVTAYSGENYGYHFPLTKGAKVACAYVNSDHSRPVLLGVLHNSESPNPVTCENSTQNIIKTDANNTIIFDDKIDNSCIKIFNHNRENIVSLNARKDSKQIRIAANAGKINLTSGKSIIMISEENSTLETNKDYLASINNNYQVNTKNGDIKIKSGKDFTIKAQRQILITTEQQNISVNNQHYCMIAAKNIAALKTNKGSLTINCNHGDLKIKANKSINISRQKNGKINISHPRAKITIDPDANFTIHAATINIFCKKTNLQGCRVKSGAYRCP